MILTVRYVGAAGDYVQVKPGTAGSVNLVGYDDSVIDFYVPIFTILQFIFYFGWLQVAETLINPFGGADDEDFDVFFLINRNFQLGFIMIQDNSDEDNLEDADEFSGDGEIEISQECFRYPRQRRRARRTKVKFQPDRC